MAPDCIPKTQASKTQDGILHQTLYAPLTHCIFVSLVWQHTWKQILANNKQKIGNNRDCYLYLYQATMPLTSRLYVLFRSGGSRHTRAIYWYVGRPHNMSCFQQNLRCFLFHWMVRFCAWIMTELLDTRPAGCEYPCSLGSDPVWEDKRQSNWWLLTCLSKDKDQSSDALLSSNGSWLGCCV